MTTRKFGLEFEFVTNQNHPGLVADLTDAGVAAFIPRRLDDYTAWQVKQDGSITVQPPKFPYGAEVASPPLDARQYRQICTVLDVIRGSSGVNSSCGMHVHVSAPELLGYLHHPIRFNVVSRNWLRIEPILFAYTPQSRRDNHYCRAGVDTESKYMALNFCPLNSNRRTVEFRLHSGTLNPLKAFAFAMLCRGIVEALAAEKPFPILAPDDTFETKPRVIRTRRGGEFWLHRDRAGNWRIESKKVKAEVKSLRVAFKELKKELRLTGKDPLQAFHFPDYGNAMTALCDFVGVNGFLKGYLGERFERMMKNNGTEYGPSVHEEPAEDEADFYNEPGYVPEAQEALTGSD